jgi:hypothetical protein
MRTLLLTVCVGALACGAAPDPRGFKGPEPLGQAAVSAITRLDEDAFRDLLVPPLLFGEAVDCQEYVFPVEGQYDTRVKVAAFFGHLSRHPSARRFIRFEQVGQVRTVQAGHSEASCTYKAVMHFMFGFVHYAEVDGGAEKAMKTTLVRVAGGDWYIMRI